MKKLISIIIISVLSVSPVFPQSWFLQETGTNQTIWVVRFISATTGFCAGPAGKIYKTTNGGNLWTETVTGYSGQIYHMCWPSQSTGYAAGESGKMQKTTNGGATWVEMPIVGASVNAMAFSNATTGYVSIVTNGTSEMYKTTNGGVNWGFELSTSGILYCIKNLEGSPSVVYSCGQNGIIFRTTNSGTNWNIFAAPSNNTLFSIFPYTITSVMAVGDNAIFRSTNTGVNWVNVTPQPQTEFLDVWMVSSTTGFAAGDQGHIFKTYNGGLNWYRLNFYEPVEFKSIFFVSETIGYFSRNDGKIIKTTNGGGDPIGIHAISSEIPQKFSLEQNYPNPFNPVTNITLSVPTAGFVSLMVYDITGRVAAELVSQNLDAGTFKYDFDASGLSSGIYFYRMHAGGFTDTKKMTLIK